MALYNTTSFRITDQALDALWLRQKTISQNLANSDTPGYKAKHVKFSGVLVDKMNASKTKSGKKELHLKTDIIVDETTNQRFDENNVDVEQQQLELARAQIQYDTLIEKMTGQFSALRTAMKL
ncbi:MAG: flagellar basal body rod protein FlgB [Clostridiales bacterium]|nr:flagellar basal body rod protein FlgB [Clostridiales bacterium]